MSIEMRRAKGVRNDAEMNGVDFTMILLRTDLTPGTSAAISPARDFARALSTEPSSWTTS